MQQDVERVHGSVTTRKDFQNEELNRLTFKDTAKSIVQRVELTISRNLDHPDAPGKPCEVTFEQRKTLLLALLVDHLIGMELLDSRQIDDMLLDVAKHHSTRSRNAAGPG